MSTSDILESLIEKDNGYLITSKAVESGVSKPSVSKYVREHDMEKVAHGIYILDNVWPDELFVLQQRNKNIIYSGETALYLHGLIDREYSHICFTDLSWGEVSETIVDNIEKISFFSDQVS